MANLLALQVQQADPFAQYLQGRRNRLADDMGQMEYQSALASQRKAAEIGNLLAGFGDASPEQRSALAFEIMARDPDLGGKLYEGAIVQPQKMETERLRGERQKTLMEADNALAGERNFKVYRGNKLLPFEVGDKQAGIAQKQASARASITNAETNRYRAGLYAQNVNSQIADRRERRGLDQQKYAAEQAEKNGMALFTHLRQIPEAQRAKAAPALAQQYGVKLSKGDTNPALYTDKALDVMQAKLGKQGTSITLPDGTTVHQGGKLTEYQYKAGAYGTRAKEADAIIQTLGSPSLIEKKLRGTDLGNYMLDDKAQRREQAERNFINAVLRKESGAVISDSEFDNARRQYFQQPGDSPGVLKQKAANRQTTIESLLTEAGQAASMVQQRLDAKRATGTGTESEEVDILQQYGLE